MPELLLHLHGLSCTETAAAARVAATSKSRICTQVRFIAWGETNLEGELAKGT